MFDLVKRPYFLRGLIAAMLSWGSAFTMFTYLRPFLERVARVDVTLLSILLLVLGCAGFVGTWASGRFVSGNVAPLLRLPALTIEDYSANEKIAYLPRKLTENGSGPFGNETVGDLCYYAPWGNLALFHGSYHWSRGLIRLGRLHQGAKPLLVRGTYPLRVEGLS